MDIEEILSLLNSSSWSNEAKQIEDYITNLQQAIKDTKDTADDMLFELKQENSKLEIALQNIQEDYDRRAKENERLKKELNNKEFVFVGTAQNKTRDFIKNLIKEKNDYKSRCEKAVDKLTIKQARFINEKDYVLDDNDLDEIMYILQNGSDSK